MSALFRSFVVLLLLCALVGCGFSESGVVDDPAAEVARESDQPRAEVKDTVVPEPADETDPEDATGGDPAPRPEPPGDTLAALAALAVKGRAPMTGYSREMFGPAWMDTDRNGCDTRNDVLAAHLTDTEVESNGCVVTAGVLADAFTATSIDFHRGHGALVDIDHVVALGNAWVTGAGRWTMQQRAALANDPLNLLPVDASANRQKGDGDAATWLPSNKGFRCAYVSRQVTVKQKYDLWVTPPRGGRDRTDPGHLPG